MTASLGANAEDDVTINTELAAVCTPTPSMGELLYPGFNSLIPQFAEQVLPNMSSLTNKEASIMLGLLYQLLDFAFRT